VLGLVVGIVGLATGIWWLALGLVASAAYLLLVLVASAAAAREGLRTGLWYLVVLPCIHFGWGTGFVLGFLGITKNITQYTGR
jgi:hypothetical protein